MKKTKQKNNHVKKILAAFWILLFNILLHFLFKSVLTNQHWKRNPSTTLETVLMLRLTKTALTESLNCR